MDNPSNKRPRSDSVLPNEHAEGQPLGLNALISKKTKPDGPSTNVVFHTTERLSQEIRTAFDLNSALKKTSKLANIGYTMTTYEEKVPPKGKHKKIMKDLRDLHRDAPAPYKIGFFPDVFDLTITRPGCEHSGLYPDLDINLLKKFHEHGVVSGYGDNQSLETKVDENVRDAREIPSNEFCVPDELLERVRSAWEEGFSMPSQVRVAPYKIHIYGPGGHFKSHRDTPEVGLVGTFLIGLGDTTPANHDGCFKIGDESLTADTGGWVAFYPDVPHAVNTIPENCYRAVIAFKIFNDANSEGWRDTSAREQQFQRRVEKILHTIPRPFGILLDHSYHLGVTDLNGYDKILLAGAQTRPDSIVHVLPVVVSTNSEYYYDSDAQDDNKSSYKTRIKPLLPAHVEILNERANE
ncbi:hypothetical protein DXG01_011027 [Tephrocybe rancida]|nr:hypothetical protein DXG01_011027 [Tephrocybe rancida]